MSFKQLETDIKSGAIDTPRPILLFGSEVYLVDYYTSKLADLFGADHSLSFDFVSFRGDEIRAADIMNAIDTFPLMSKLKVIVVHDYKWLSGKLSSDSSGESLFAYLENLPDYARVIFAGDKINKTTSAYKKLTKCGQVYEFGKLNESTLRSFIAKRLKETGVGITAEILNAFIYESGYLEENSDKDLLAIMNDAYRLGTYAHAAGRDRITESDLQDCMGITLRKNVFQMLDYISTGQKGPAVELLEQSFALGESAFGFIALLVGQFEIMLAYKEMSEVGYSTDKMLSILNIKSDYRLKKLGGYSRSRTKLQLMDALHKLYNLEKEIRLGNISEKLGLTVLVSVI